MKKLNSNGFSHGLLIIAVVVVSAVVGVGLIVASHAATSQPCVTKTFRQGATGKCVKNIQVLVSHVGTKPATYLQADGRYGTKTTTAVLGFQMSIPLKKPNGIVNKETWKSLCLASLAYQKKTLTDSVEVNKAVLDSGCATNW